MTGVQSVLFRSPGSDFYLIGSDIVDFYPSIDLDRLQSVVKRTVMNVVNEETALFIVGLVELLLNHKYISLGNVGVEGSIYKNKKSLSIGERIDTAAASILRRDLKQDTLAHFDLNIVRHFAYVDDTLSFLAGTPDQVQQITNALDDCIHPLKWTHSVSRCSADSTARVDLLDINLQASLTPGFVVNWKTSLYRKPSFVPQFLTFASDHRHTHKNNILIGESFRTLVASSHHDCYYDSMSIVAQALKRRGHPQRVVPPYDCIKRIAQLHKFGKRKPLGFHASSTVNFCAFAPVAISSLSMDSVFQSLSRLIWSIGS